MSARRMRSCPSLTHPLLRPGSLTPACAPASKVLVYRCAGKGHARVCLERQATRCLPFALPQRAGPPLVHGPIPLPARAARRQIE